MTQSANPTLYVGTYAVRNSKGIYVFAFDPNTGTATLQQTVNDGKSPSFLAIHPSGQYLYAVNEEDEQGPDQSGTISAYAIDRSGKLAFVSNYGSGSLTVLPISPDGSLNKASQVIQHTGHSVDPERQASPHVHSAVVSIDNRLLYVSDLGTDTIHVYQIDEQQSRISAGSATPYVRVSAGSGPRMLVVHPSDEWLYSLKEMSSTVARLRRDRQTNAVELVEDDIPFLNDTFTGERSGGHIHLDTDGQHLLVTNRGNNTLAIFALETDGTLTQRGLHYTGGDEPRNFLLDERSGYLLIGHQESDTITVFKLDTDRDTLTATGDQLSVPAPVCLLMQYRA